MATASGIFKQVAYKLESSYGVKPSAASAQSLRRVTSSIDLTKDTYQSNEIRADFQVADFRHGVRRVQGTINGELSAKTYGDFFAAILKKAWVATAAITGVSLDVAIVAGSPEEVDQYSVTRSTGSFLTDDIKVGHVIRLSGANLDAGNINKNLLVIDVTATVLKVIVLNGSAMVVEPANASSTVTVVGKTCYTPQTGHTDQSFSIEHWFPDVPTSEVFTGCKPSKISLNLPPTGMATIAVDFAGKDIETQSGQYFTTPVAATTTGCMAAVNGVCRVGGVSVANVTGLTIDINCAQSGEPVVGSNTIPFQTSGRVIVSGQATLLFDSVTMRDAFINETETSLYAVFTASNAANADFIGFSIPRLKVGGSSKDDGEKSLILTVPFQGLLNSAGGTDLATDLTTIIVQDSQM